VSHSERHSAFPPIHFGSEEWAEEVERRAPNSPAHVAEKGCCVKDRLKIVDANVANRGVLLVVACLVALAGLASANPSTPKTFPTAACPVHGSIESNVSYSCAAEFTLRASNGYRITVSADAEGQTDEVVLSVEGHGGNVRYSVPGKVTTGTIRAKSAISAGSRCAFVHPVASGTSGCRRNDPLANTPKKLQCDFRESEAERERELESVSLNGAPPRAAISFNASRLFGDFPALAGSGKPLPPKGDRYLFLALASEKVGRMSILRSTGALGESRDFAVDDDLTSATADRKAR
jgi:hypothetical protein